MNRKENGGAPFPSTFCMPPHDDQDLARTSRFALRGGVGEKKREREKPFFCRGKRLSRNPASIIATPPSLFPPREKGEKGSRKKERNAGHFQDKKERD
jgi:hypothetical protein